MNEMTLLDFVIDMIDEGRTDEDIIAVFGNRFSRPGMLPAEHHGDPRPMLSLLRRAMREVIDEAVADED